MQTQLVVKSAVFPLQKFLYRSSCPFAEADDGPQTEAQCATATKTTTQKPPHIHRECLSQAAVHTIDTGFEFLWCHLSCKCWRKFWLEFVTESKHSYVAGPSHHYRVRSILKELFFRGPVLVLLFLLLLFVDLIKVLHHRTTRPRASRERHRERHDADKQRNLTEKWDKKYREDGHKNIEQSRRRYSFTSFWELWNKTSTSAAVTVRHRKGDRLLFRFFFKQVDS